MISIELKGGLGNQLFQIMATIAHSIRTNIPFVFSRDKFRDEGPNRPTYWTTLFRHLEPHLNTHRQIVTKDIEAYTPIYQDDRKYTPIPPPTSENTLLKGYYQDYRYFDDVYDQILEITGLPEIRQEILSKYLAKEDQENTIRISMHFRRGDYCRVRCYHPVLTETYYTNALISIMKYLKYNTDTHIQIVCFYETADKEEVLRIIDHVRELTDAGSYTNIEYITDKYRDLADWEQLLVMSGHDHHIIANSTFSWWSAYLNPSQKKMVFYPDTWTGHQLYYIDTNGLRVAGWHRITTFGPFEKICDC